MATPGATSDQSSGAGTPWSSLVAFHKEIARRAAEDFFSFIPTDTGSDRWSPVDSLEPHDLTGALAVPVGSIRSPLLRQALQQGNFETVFLGGVSFARRDRDRDGKWFDTLQPVFFREFAPSWEDETLTLSPAQGKWNLTPVFLQHLDRINVPLPEHPEIFATQVLEAAKTGDGRISLETALRRALFASIPTLESSPGWKANFTASGRTSTSWLLFGPPKGVSPLTQDVLRDYERMQERIAARPPAIGGLALLSPQVAAVTPAQGKPQSVRAFVSLNDSQRNAVTAVLSGSPLTVISGPPGTGKSQVVLALILNAWAAGKSVLFASQNNKAVDVVRQRLEEFESEFPIAVRAGAFKHQNVTHVLTRTLSMAAHAKHGALALGSLRDLQKKAASLQSQLQSVRGVVDSGVPQRIEESHRAALQEYAQHCALEQEISEYERSLAEAGQALGIHGTNHAQVMERITRTRHWIDRIPHYRALIKADEHRREELTRSVSVSASLRRDTAAELGLSEAEAGDWAWVSSGPTVELLEDWEQKARDLLTSDLESSLEPIHWRGDFDRWNTAEEAGTFARQAGDFSETLRRALESLGPAIAQLEEAQGNLAGQAGRLRDLGLAEGPSISSEVVDAWIGAYADMTTRPASIFDRLPFSSASAIRRRLVEAEVIIRRCLPLAVLTKLGPLNSQSRARLAGLVEGIRDWLRAQRTWLSLQHSKDSVDSTFNELRSEGRALRLPAIPANYRVATWEPLVQASRDLQTLAEQAAAAWTKRDSLQRAQSSLRAVAKEGLRCGIGVPLREAWARGLGSQLTDSLNALEREPNLAAVASARTALYAGGWARLCSVWRRVAELHLRVRGADGDLAVIPSEAQQIAGWWGEKPLFAELGQPAGGTGWPDTEPYLERLGLLQAWCERFASFDGSDRPRLHSSSRDTRARASMRLQQAASLLPDTAEGQVARQGVEALLAAGKPWPLEQLSASFEAFSAERLRAQAEGLAATLAHNAFQQAKVSWLERLRLDDGAVRAVDELEKALKKSKLVTPESSHEHFRDALRIVPIWITTALATRSIPLEPELFDLVVIDEASQCTLTNLLPLMFRGKSLVVIGDPEQLPAIPNVRAAEELALATRHGVEGFLNTLGHVDVNVYSAALQFLPRQRGDELMLTEHFRSHPLIIGFSNRHVYQRRLELRKRPNASIQLPVPAGVHSLRVAGSCQRGDGGQSWRNDLEAGKVVEQVASLKTAGQGAFTIGVVTPFVSQKKLILALLERRQLAADVLVDTADGFQGDERDVIIFSPVVSKGVTESAAKWVEHPTNRINVALTRAREALIVVGDLDFCRTQKGLLRSLALYCDDIELLRRTSPAELELFSWMTMSGLVPRVHTVIGDIEVDFSLEGHGFRLAIEVDGSEHHQHSTQADGSRDAFLLAKGWDVLRVPARDVLQTPSEVLHLIRARLGPASQEMDPLRRYHKDDS